MFTVGTWIYTGRSGKERNLDESFRWQKLAADAGHPGATFNIGTIPCD
jgi:TPR repeat protein